MTSHPQLKRRNSHDDEKNPGHRRRRLAREADDFVREKTKIQIRTAVDAARNGGGDRTLGQLLEIRRYRDRIPVTCARGADRKRAETSRKGMGRIRFRKS